MILIGGELGVGKTRLALEAADYASRFGFGFLMGRCYEGEDLRPHLPFAEIIEMALDGAPSMDEFRAAIADDAPALAQIAPRLRRLFPDIPPLPKLPPEDTRRYLFKGVSETFMRVARRVPLFLLLEDLQWADESSLGLLAYLANHVARVRLVIVATYRDRDLGHQLDDRLGAGGTPTHRYPSNRTTGTFRGRGGDDAARLKPPRSAWTTG